MSLLRRLHLFYRNHRLGRVIAATLLLAAGLAQPGTAPVLAAPPAVAPPAPQSGCGVVVNTTDNAVGSLRWTVGCVAAGTTVTFLSGLAGQTISLTTGEIAIAQSIAIDGSGAPGIIVDAGNTSRVFNISASGPVTLTALTLQHGSSDVGGAVFDNVSSPLVLNSVRVLSSTVVAGTGGGLFAAGPLTLTNSDFISDTSTSNGGGVVAGGAAVVTGGRFERDTCTTGGCDGGGVFGFASLTVSGTQFISNTSLSHGGAAYTLANAVLTNGSFQGNQCTDSVNGCFGGGLFAGSTVTLTGTDFISNISTSDGGGAYVTGATRLTGGSFQGNQCNQAGCRGGGLYANNSLTLTGTVLISNHSHGAGGGAFAFRNAVLTRGSFQDNQCADSFCQAGGLYFGTTLTLTDTQFISNTSSGNGGGVKGDGAAVLTNGRFQGNKCTANGCLGGGVKVNGALLLTGSSFEGNQCTGNGCHGGGLAAYGITVSAFSSSFSGNQSAGVGGAIDLTSTSQITLVNVTLSDNMAGVAGGGVYAGGTSTASLYNVTLADNTAPSGGGMAADISATLGVTNTIIASNGASNCLGTIARGTHNLEFPGNTCATAGPSAGFTPADPLLAPLALNAPGATLTQALLPGSPARDHGDPVSCANSLVNNLDQRGAVRPDAGGEACDIGAYEAGPPDWLVFLPLVHN